MKWLLFLLLVVPASLFAQQKKIVLYPGKPPGAEKWNWQEGESPNNAFKTPIVYNVVQPSLTAFIPDKAIANGTAIIVCPGGAFHTLSINNEGNELARWLNNIGVTAFVLRYRLVHSVTNDPVQEQMSKMGDFKKLDEENDTVVNMAIADGKKAIEYVREHAADYQVNPNRIGIMGFSAGGTLTMGVGYSYTAQNRPDFLAPIYPYLGALRRTTVPEDAPPVFVCAASDDQLKLAPHSVQIYSDWLKAGRSAELHMYLKGGHGFGMRKQGLPVDSWIERFGDWLKMNGWLNK